jgi:hypothetical protein
MINLPAELIDRFRTGNGTFFLSAGCSIPSGIPSAQVVAQDVALFEYERSGSTDDLATFKVATFGDADPKLDVVAEYFYLRDGNIDAFLSAIRFDEWSKPDNLAHRGVVRLAREGIVRRVLTTNWDQLIEVAAHQMGCACIPIRRQQELGRPDDTELKLIKIHGCLTDHASIIAATSQIEGAQAQSLWAQPQVAAMFQDKSVIFIGYSGSSRKIPGTLAEVIQLSPEEVQHYAVDVASWEDFSANAEEFVAAASLTEERFYRCGAEEFVSALVDKILRAEVIHIVHGSGPGELEDILALIEGAAAEFVADDAFVEGLATADSSEAFMSGLLRKITGLPPLRPNARLVARVAAWTSFLAARGWTPVYGLPVMRRDRDRLYLAALQPGMAARKLAQHVASTLSNDRVRRVVLGEDPDAAVTCLLLMAQGDAGNPAVDGIAGASGGREPGQPSIRFLTEEVMLREAMGDG